MTVATTSYAMTRSAVMSTAAWHLMELWYVSFKSYISLKRIWSDSSSYSQLSEFIFVVDTRSQFSSLAWFLIEAQSQWLWLGSWQLCFSWPVAAMMRLGVCTMWNHQKPKNVPNHATLSSTMWTTPTSLQTAPFSFWRDCILCKVLQTLEMCMT